MKYSLFNLFVPCGTYKNYVVTLNSDPDPDQSQSILEIDEPHLGTKIRPGSRFRVRFVPTLIGLVHIEKLESRAFRKLL